MRKLVVFLGLVALGLGSSPVWAATDCEAARCAVQMAIDTECPCDLTGATNHGQHVSCVAHVVNRLSKQNPPAIPINCKGRIKRCAARSICGKAGFVTCQIPVAGTCDLTTMTCERTGLPCLTDAECTTTKCKTKASSDLCMAAGGTVGGGTTCCASCQ